MREKTLLHPASHPASHVYTLLLFFFYCRKLSLLMRLCWACEGWTTSTPSASPPKINLAVLTIMETSTVDLNVSVTHLRLLRLVQDLNRVKIWGEHCSLQTSPQSLRMAVGGRGSVSTGQHIFFSQALFGQSWSGKMLQFLWLSGTNKPTVTPALHNVWHGVSKCENDRAARTNSDLHTFEKKKKRLLSLPAISTAETHQHLCFCICAAWQHFIINAVLSQILPLSNNCSFKWFVYCTQAHYNFDYILIDFAALIFPA